MILEAKKTLSKEEIQNKEFEEQLKKDNLNVVSKNGYLFIKRYI